MARKTDVLDGDFEYRRSTVALCALGIVFGAGLIICFLVYLFAVERITPDDAVALAVLSAVGAVYLFICGGILYMKRKAYILVDESGISAFCQFGCSLNCAFSEVGAVSYHGEQLTVKLKNGKRYTLFHLGNAARLGGFILDRMGNTECASRNIDGLRSEARALTKRAKRNGISAAVVFLGIFAEILIAAALTGWKDMEDFSVSDWRIFAVMCVALTVTAITFVLLLRGFILMAERADETKKALFRAILLHSPAPSGGAVAMFVNDKHAPQIRSTVYRYPDSEEAYFILEAVNSAFELETVGKSQKEYASVDELRTDMKQMSEIPLPSVK